MLPQGWLCQSRRRCCKSQAEGAGSAANISSHQAAGAGEGNRTLVISLEGCCSTIELHPLSRVVSGNYFVCRRCWLMCFAKSLTCPAAASGAVPLPIAPCSSRSSIHCEAHTPKRAGAVLSDFARAIGVPTCVVAYWLIKAGDRRVQAYALQIRHPRLIRCGSWIK
jgi:hypothetical protein